MQQPTYDVIVIGSGIGGMTAASLLCQFYQKKVLIVERHWTFGGLTHEFARGDARFATGVHYLGDMGENHQARQILNAITGNQVQMQAMVDPFDEVIFPNFRFGFTGDLNKNCEKLQAVFPKEKPAIAQFFRMIKAYNSYMQIHIGFQSFIPKFFGFLKPLLRWFNGVDMHLTVQAYLDRHFKDPLLKAVLAARWGDYGVPPQQAALLVHSLVVYSHYQHGAYFPQGGAGTIGEAVKKVIAAHQGDILLETEANEIIIENNRAVGIKAKNKQGEILTFYAEVVVSDAGADITYNQLLAKHPQATIQEAIAKSDNTVSFLGIYLVLNTKPEELGFQGANLWMHSDQYIGQEVVSVESPHFPTSAVLFFPTLKGQQSDPPVVEVLVPVYYKDFEKWAEQPWQHRDEAYQALKAALGEKVMQFIGQYFPDLSSAVVRAEVSSPLTMQTFTGRRLGSPYGVAFTPKRFDQDWLSAHTPIPNVFLAGQDAGSLGIVGAMMGGLGAASQVVGGNGFMELMKKIKNYPKQ